MSDKKTEKYIEAVGRRKTAVARVRITPASKNTFVVNGKNLSEYFELDELIKVSESALNEVETKYGVSAKVLGGGKNSQAGAIRLAISRCLVKEDQENRKTLKKLGFLKRDPRVKERKKPGLRKARRSQQWRKR